MTVQTIVRRVTLSPVSRPVAGTVRSACKVEMTMRPAAALYLKRRVRHAPVELSFTADGEALPMLYMVRRVELVGVDGGVCHIVLHGDQE